MAERANIVVHLPAPLRPYAGGAAEIAVAATTVEAALAALVSQHPRLRRHLFMDMGALRGYVNVFVNEAEMRTLPKAGATRLAPGDVITILPSIAGG